MQVSSIGFNRSPRAEEQGEEIRVPTAVRLSPDCVESCATKVFSVQSLSAPAATKENDCQAVLSRRVSPVRIADVPEGLSELPKAYQFPIDTVCNCTAHALWGRGWSAPDISVEFGVKTDRFPKEVARIEGLNFRILYGHRTAEENVSACIINIPGMELHVHGDESGPLLYVYVGNTWQRDGKDFVHCNKLGGSTRDLQRRYIGYSGCWRKVETPRDRCHLPGQRAPNLEIMEEYSEQAKKAHIRLFYSTEEVFRTFVSYLEEHVLKPIQKLGIVQK